MSKELEEYIYERVGVQRPHSTGKKKLTWSMLWLFGGAVPSSSVVGPTLLHHGCKFLRGNINLFHDHNYIVRFC